ncbi:unnamed protein product [Protopolystoma xenopodis]|uniref:Uncharacterized protein n=1 Tax=Protopolystoma xenopodis TaxID=117903 RepID=A0A3S5A2U7_9PLAT|nr:unnamed protein product [Protopolystoma xenopodis]
MLTGPRHSTSPSNDICRSSSCLCSLPPSPFVSPFIPAFSNPTDQADASTLQSTPIISKSTNDAPDFNPYLLHSWPSSLIGLYELPPQHPGRTKRNHMADQEAAGAGEELEPSLVLVDRLMQITDTSTV